MCRCRRTSVSRKQRKTRADSRLYGIKAKAWRGYKPASGGKSVARRRPASCSAPGINWQNGAPGNSMRELLGERGEGESGDEEEDSEAACGRPGQLR
ncbi:hypothetical protein RTG_01637 [Rhodotorula toruloides ATCC 204091]|uniref:Uncharacterized protein n=1 Tax=Rhodotorula toruloides TaxID=5286 RepID=A0A2S9ZWZ1_RHOTO|nr:hypothetical protein RTG_01637 [Rhodotorula toruloides ATCC 204091]PRQ70268.1 hypothetical protein AAT19DRAFT_11500 [Rhodotorula toruloides]